MCVCLFVCLCVHVCVCVCLFILPLECLGRESVTLSEEMPRTPDEDVGVNLKDPDREAIKFEKVCLLTKTKTLL